MNRRMFLKGLTFGAAGLALPGVGSAGEKPAAGVELATLLDLNRCIGCGACVEACREANADKFPEPKKPFPPMVPKRSKPEDFSDKREERERLTPYNWLFIQTAEVDWQGERRTLNMPRRCLHCRLPPCANLCPWGAARKEANGAVRIDEGICLGGAKCRDVCPWSIPQRQSGVGLYLDLAPRLAGNGVMYKCDRCFARLASGGLPACIEACPEGVQKIGPREAIVAEAKALAEATGGYLYGLTENGGTNTIYVSPVPFEVLDAAIDKGPGKPHLKPVAGKLSGEKALAAAALLAPLAGLAAGALRLVRAAKETNEEVAKEDRHE